MGVTVSISFQHHYWTTSGLQNGPKIHQQSMQSCFHTALPNSPHSWPTSARHLLPNVSVAGLKILILAWLLLFIMQIVCFPFSSFQPPLLPPPLGSIQAHKTSDIPPTNASKHVPRFIQLSSIVLPRFGSILEPILAPRWHHFSLKCHNRNEALWPFSCLAPFSAPGLAKVSP